MRRSEAVADATTRARLSPEGWIAQRVSNVPGAHRPLWMCAFVHPSGFIAVDLLTDHDVREWAPLLPRWARQDDEYEPETVWGDE